MISTPEQQDVTLLDLLDRIVDRGVVLSGDLTISVADVDLIVVGLRLLLASADRLEQAGLSSARITAGGPDHA